MTSKDIPYIYIYIYIYTIYLILFVYILYLSYICPIFPLFPMMLFILEIPGGFQVPWDVQDPRRREDLGDGLR